MDNLVRYWKELSRTIQNAGIGSKACRRRNRVPSRSRHSWLCLSPSWSAAVNTRRGEANLQQHYPVLDEQIQAIAVCRPTEFTAACASTDKMRTAEKSRVYTRRRQQFGSNDGHSAACNTQAAKKKCRHAHRHLRGWSSRHGISVAVSFSIQRSMFQPEINLQNS